MARLPKHTLAARRAIRKIMDDHGVKSGTTRWPRRFFVLPWVKRQAETTFMFENLAWNMMFAKYVPSGKPKFQAELYRMGLICRNSETESGFGTVREWSDCVDAVRRAAACAEFKDFSIDELIRQYLTIHYEPEHEEPLSNHQTLEILTAATEGRAQLTAAA
jgi:hypothetical protein